MRKIDCYVGAILSILLAVSILRYEGVVRALESEPEVVETVVEEVEVEEPDYESMASACYAHVKEKDLQVVERVGMEFADGVAVNRNNDFLYLADTVYFPDSLMIRFVGSQGRVVTVFANQDRVFEESDLSSMPFSEPSGVLADMCTLMKSIAQYSEAEMVLSDRQLLESYFSDSKVRSKLELTVGTVDEVSIGYANMGRTSRELGYMDVVVIQLLHGEEHITVLLKLDECSRVVNMDVL